LNGIISFVPQEKMEVRKATAIARYETIVVKKRILTPFMRKLINLFYHNKPANSTRAVIKASKDFILP
ncbi:MAG: hypothetical protein J6V69_05025, partial [Clostridia bacterium]|nr:hypothetical protein [Clostridia bacterium]